MKLYERQRLENLSLELVRKMLVKYSAFKPELWKRLLWKSVIINDSGRCPVRGQSLGSRLLISCGATPVQQVIRATSMAGQMLSRLGRPPPSRQYGQLDLFR